MCYTVIIHNIACHIGGLIIIPAALMQMNLIDSLHFNHICIIKYIYNYIYIIYIYVTVSINGLCWITLSDG